MLMRQRVSHKGFTLIELMVGLTIGLIVIGVVGSVFLSILRSTSDTLESLKLNQEMRAVMALIVSDVRRAGYWEGAVDEAGTVGFENPFTTRENVERDIQIHDSGQCVMFSYDLDVDDDGLLFDDEASANAAPLMGFRLTQGDIWGIVTGVDMSAGGGQDTASCGGPFQRFTDERILEVTGLNFSTEGSVCLNLDQDVSWTMPAASTLAACDDAAPGYTADTGDRLVEVRNIHITMSGRHAADNDVEMDLESDVLVRTNRTLIAN